MAFSTTLTASVWDGGGFSVFPMLATSQSSTYKFSLSYRSAVSWLLGAQKAPGAGCTMSSHRPLASSPNVEKERGE